MEHIKLKSLGQILYEARGHKHWDLLSDLYRARNEAAADAVVLEHERRKTEAARIAALSC